MDMEASLFDMDLLGSWDLSQLLAGPDVLVSEQARGLVLPGLSPAGHWSPCGPSPVEEDQQDTLWLDPTDVLSGSPELFSGSQHDDFSRQYKKLSTSFLFDDDSQALPLTSDFLLGSDHISSPSSTLGTSPIDVKFEFGDVYSDEQALDYLTDTSTQVIDNVCTQQTFPAFDHSPTFTSCRPALILGSYETDQVLIDSYETESVQFVVDSAVPTSPFSESCSSPLDSLEYDDDDSLHDAENVYQLLLSLDGGIRRGAGSLHGTSQILSHVSPEEVESVLSRDSSSDDLVALCDGSLMRSSTARMSECMSIELEFAASSGPSFQRCCSASTASRVPVDSGFAISTASHLPIAHDSTVSSVSHLPFGNVSSLTSASRLPAIPSSTVSGFTNSYTIASPAGSLPAVIGSEYCGASLANKMDLCGAGKSRAAPYREVPIERRVRKKEQNKTAALRYRQKKREEKGHTMTEVEELEQQNQVLKNRADDLSKEISYLRGLLEEIKR